MNCQYCNKKFANKYNLSHHQTTTKYCLLIQQTTTKPMKTQEQIISDLQWEVKILQTQNKSLQADKDKLEDKLENALLRAIAKPSVQNNKINQVINNLTPLTDEHLNSQVHHLTIDHIKDGANGYARYAEHPLKNKVMCTDFSRKKLQFKDDDGNIVIDPESSKVSKKVFTSIHKRNDEITDEYINEMRIKISEETDPTRVGYLADELVQAVRQRRDVDDIVNGGKPALYHNFVKNICLENV